LNHIFKKNEGFEFLVREMMIMFVNICAWLPPVLMLMMLSSNQLLASSQEATTPSGKSTGRY
jgi:hypothetical protein